MSIGLEIEKQRNKQANKQNGERMFLNGRGESLDLLFPESIIS